MSLKIDSLLFICATIALGVLHIPLKIEENHQQTMSLAGVTNPHFEARTIKNTNIDITRLAKLNKLIVINFFEEWCKPCQEEMPYLENIHEQYAPQGVIIIGVFNSSRISRMEEFLNRYNITFDIVHDDNKHIMKIFNIEAFPTTVVLNSDLKIIRSVKGIDINLTEFIRNRIEDLR